MIRALALLLALAAAPASAQFLPISSDINQRPMPVGVSIPTIAPSDVVYPGCPTPPTSFGNVWTIDPRNGFAMNDYTNGTNGAPTVTTIGGANGQGTAAHPWKSLEALFTFQTGYPTPLLSTVNASTGPIHPGDEVVLMTGSATDYGEIVGGGLDFTTAEIINNPALTIVAGAGQTPVLARLQIWGGTGFVFRNIAVRSLATTGTFGALIDIQDAQIPGQTSSNFVFDHMDVSSTDVATADGWTTQSQWQTNARLGIRLVASNFNPPSGASDALTCVSVTNSHIYVTQNGSASGIQALGKNALVMNNEIDHATGAIDYSADNFAAINNYGHDFIEVQNATTPLPMLYGQAQSGGPTHSNQYMTRNKMLQNIDPAITNTVFSGPGNGIFNSNGIVSNVVITDNLFAMSGNSALYPGTTTNGIIANNSVIDGGITSVELGGVPSVSVGSSHGGTTGVAIGALFTSNFRIFNNIVPAYAYIGNNVQADHNISTGITVGGSPVDVYAYWPNGYSAPVCFLHVSGTSPPPTGCSLPNTVGSVTAAPASTGAANLVDGIGQANEFTAVPTPGSFPMSPVPNFTLLSGSPAKTAGGAVLVPPIADFNGTPFAPPYSRGALN